MARVGLICLGSAMGFKVNAFFKNNANLMKHFSNQALNFSFKDQYALYISKHMFVDDDVMVVGRGLGFVLAGCYGWSWSWLCL